MIHVSQHFGTFWEAEQFVEGYLRNYHPAGYGTHLTIDPSPEHPAGPWHVHGHRGSSSD